MTFIQYACDDDDDYENERIEPSKFNHRQNHGHIRSSLQKSLGRYYALLVFIGLIGSCAVALGAYGAHVLGPNKAISQYRKQVYEIANKYQFYHTLALALVPLARKPQISGLLFLLGMALFCGSNYYYALSGDMRFIMLTPTGGVTLAVAWLSLLIPA